MVIALIDTRLQLPGTSFLFLSVLLTLVSSFRPFLENHSLFTSVKPFLQLFCCFMLVCVLLCSCLRLIMNVHLSSSEAECIISSFGQHGLGTRSAHYFLFFVNTALHLHTHNYYMICIRLLKYGKT